MNAHAHEFEITLAGSAPLARWDPRAKWLGLLPMIVVLACVQSTPAAMIGIGVSVLVVLAGGLPVGFAARRVGWLLLMIAPVLLVLPWFGPGEVVGRLGALSIYANGVRTAGMIAARACGIFLLMLAILYTAPLSDTVWALEALGVPRSLTQLVLIALRYLPILGHELQTTRTAAACRGHTPHANAHTYRTAASIAGATFVRGYHRAQRVWNAMACRGFAGRLYPLRAWRLEATDVVACLATWTAAAAILVLDWWC